MIKRIFRGLIGYSACIDKEMGAQIKRPKHGMIII
jgi:hypothetical protein